MTQAGQSGVIWTVVIATIVLLVAGIFAYASIPTASEVASKIVVPAVVLPAVPTAAQIAAEIETSGGSSSSIDEILCQETNKNQCQAIENQCVNNLQDGFSNEDIIDKVEALLEATTGKQVASISVDNWNYENAYNIDITNFGLDNKADRAATITSTLRVSYRFVNGNQDYIKETIDATASCSDWDTETGHVHEFDNLNFNLVIA